MAPRGCPEFLALLRGRTSRLLAGGLLAGLLLNGCGDDDRAAASSADESDETNGGVTDSGADPDPEAPTGPDADGGPEHALGRDASTEDPASPTEREAGASEDASVSLGPRLPDTGAASPEESDAASPSGDTIDEELLSLLTRPAYPEPVYPVENPYSEPKALLGKVLFWEEQLSGDGTVACGTCHRGAAGGSDPRAVHLPGPDGLSGTDDDIQGSPGIIRCNSAGEQTGDAAQVTDRRTSNYLDAMFAPNLFWDGRAECRHEDCPSQSAFEDPDNPGTFPISTRGALENQAVMPPLSNVEMACEGTTWPDIHERLETAIPLALASDIPLAMTDFINEHDASYPAMFAAAFGEEQTSGPTDEINTRRIAFAIATHERQLRSNETPWDAFNAGDREALSEAQTRGYIIFRTKAECGSCHAPPLFTAHQFHFTGFHEPAWDEGRYAVTMNESDHGKMRTPTLRNVGLRVAGGLLHNGGGRGLSLSDVIDTYASGGMLENEAIAEVPVSPSVPGFELTDQEKTDLIDFLVNGLTDPRVQSEQAPFDRPTLSTEL